MDNGWNDVGRVCSGAEIHDLQRHEWSIRGREGYRWWVFKI
jgi:hypothetical protein